MKESNLTLKIRKALEREFPGSRWIKIAGGKHQERGVSDLIGCVNGRFVSVEVKLDESKYGLSALQKDFLEEVKEAGGISIVVHNLDEAISSLKELINQQKSTTPP
jgi:hypothetical protein